MANCCPLPSALTVIDDSVCGLDMKQIQKIIIQRPSYVFDTAAGTPTDPSLKADWDVLVAATDDTKVVTTSRRLAGVETTAGDAVTIGGGDNSTRNGIELLAGFNPSTLIAKVISPSVAEAKALRALECEDVVVYLVNQDNQIFGLSTDVATQFVGIPVEGRIKVGDRTNKGYNTLDEIEISFQLKARWDSDLKVITPEAGFSPLADI